jgi:hypothetical protein
LVSNFAAFQMGKLCAATPRLMLDIMLSMRAQGIGVVQGVIDATDG